MKDSFGRDITYLRLSVTELCNLRCRYCMPETGVQKRLHEEMLTEEEMVSAVSVASELGIRKVRIIGGEPLVKRNILSIAERIASVPGISEVCVTT
ncbi:MAG: radical SAM protein, partial [Clostridia bacterium]|nr:radical SAM protein [Clostridia bacterium]